TKLEGTALVAALIIVAVWLAFLIWLAFHSDATEVKWARLLAVLGSLEAVAFGAAGALFGTTIQKRRVEEGKERANIAEERAAEAQKVATANAEGAANGKALATMIKARAESRATEEGIERVSTGNRSGQGVDDDLLVLAKRLFPD